MVIGFRWCRLSYSFGTDHFRIYLNRAASSLQWNSWREANLAEKYRNPNYTIRVAVAMLFTVNLQMFSPAIPAEWSLARVLLLTAKNFSSKIEQFEEFEYINPNTYCDAWKSTYKYSFITSQATKSDFWKKSQIMWNLT